MYDVHRGQAYWVITLDVNGEKLHEMLLNHREARERMLSLLAIKKLAWIEPVFTSTQVPKQWTI